MHRDDCSIEGELAWAPFSACWSLAILEGTAAQETPAGLIGAAEEGLIEQHPFILSHRMADAPLIRQPR